MQRKNKKKMIQNENIIGKIMTIDFIEFFILIKKNFIFIYIYIYIQIYLFNIEVLRQIFVGGSFGEKGFKRKIKSFFDDYVIYFWYDFNKFYRY